MSNVASASPSATSMRARSATLTWMLLVLLTIAGWLFARQEVDGGALVALVAFAAIKVYLIMAVFMGVWSSPKAWHVAAIVWTIATFGLILTFAIRSIA
jgi:heme/copper-type cytochrome/quinol oxidase subunit 4